MGPNPPIEPGSSPRVLRRSRADRMIGGVCGGLARYFDVDPVLLRIAAVALVLASGFGLVGYVIAWIVIPEDDGEPVAGPRPAAAGLLPWYLGVALIAIGGVLLLRVVAPWFGTPLLWPLVIVVTGIAVLVVAAWGRRT
ncbi:hypothetical protein ADL15_45740 [Actinoplanes awajinensis subsp. mycoplanecinus]|uniref:Phage shock protein PspC N-terminal domain-containing protein n=1 Tax=Actinoplanes awajinensis subsp. mycoplanecinus TaxID=135947 RepID=A0A101JBA3_9ACTN|nr:hypothetical protein ADL15_45740 [Actinoplanes awajinensis subsp. mycoplanecinus]